MLRMTINKICSFLKELSEGLRILKSPTASGPPSLKRWQKVIIISEFSLDRKDIPVPTQHNLKTFHERVFESDFYLLYFRLDYGCIIHSSPYELAHQLGKLLIFLDRKIREYNLPLLVRFN